MKNKKHIGQLISIKFTDRKTPINGIVIDYNDDWTLMQYTSDYMIDGYIIFRHKNLEGFIREKKEKFIEKVIKLKGEKPLKKSLVPLTSLEAILKHLTKKVGVFQIETKDETVCYLGNLKSIDSKQLVINYLDVYGKWSGTRKFKPSEIRVIQFDTDYINSLKLVAKPKKVLK